MHYHEALDRCRTLLRRALARRIPWILARVLPFPLLAQSAVTLPLGLHPRRAQPAVGAELADRQRGGFRARAKEDLRVGHLRHLPQGTLLSAKPSTPLG